MLQLATRLLADDDGTTAIEYALIASLISIIIIGAISSIGTTMSASFFGPIAGAL